MAAGVPALLLIFDDPHFAYLIERYAQTSGCTCVSIHDQEAGPAIVATVHPVIIVIEIGPVPAHGWQMLARLKADSALAAIPVAVCVALIDTALTAEKGADFYLGKPVFYDDFRIVLSEAGVSLPG
jgi:DNA-binding response OmpR family regulator